jgi:hypothetical protein
MNLQSLVVVVLRLMALDFLLGIAVQLTPQILVLLQERERLPLNESLSLMGLPLLVLIGWTIAAVLVWCLALPIARFVTRGVSHDLSFGAMSLVDCYSIAFMAVGLFYISSHLPQVLNWAHHFLKTAASGRREVNQAVSGYEVSHAIIPFIVGVVLFVNGRRWAVTLARRQAERSAPSTVTEKT